MLKGKYAKFITTFQSSLIDLLLIKFILPVAVETSNQFCRSF